MKRIWLAVLLTGCAFMPEDAVPFEPPALYHDLWDSAQACTGRRGDFSQLRFFVVEGISFDTPQGPATGWTEGTTITLASEWVDHPLVVKHELIHALGIDGHPYVPFVDPCHATWDSWEELLPS